MNYFDLFVLVAFIIAFIQGIRKGFILELASLVALVTGIAGAVFLSGVTAQWLSEYITSRYITILAFVILLVGIIILVFVTAKLVDAAVKTLALGWLNRATGAFFAVIKAAFGISLIIFVLEFAGLGTRVIPLATRDHSRMFTPLERFAPATFDLLKINYQHLLPGEYRQELPPRPVIVLTATIQN